MAQELELWDCTWKPRRTGRGVEMSIPPSNEWKGTTCDWRGYEIVSELSYLWIERIWNPLREEEGWEEIAEGRVESVGTIVLSEQGWHLFCTTLAAGQNPMWLLGDAEAKARQAGESFANKGWDTVSSRVVMGGWKEFKPSSARIKTWVPEFVADWFGGFDPVTEVVDTMERIHVNCTWLAGEFYRTSLKYGPFHGDRARELLIILDIERNDRQEVAPETREAIIRREVAATPCYVDDVFKLFECSAWIASREIKGECAMARRRTFLEERPLGIEPPREVQGGIEVSLPATGEGWDQVADWVGIELAENMVYLVTKVEWRAAENGEWNLDPRGHVRAEGRLYVSENGWREFEVRLASGEDPLSMFEGAWQLVWQAGFEFADPGVDDVTADLRVAMVGSFELPSENVRMRQPPFLLEKLGGLELVRQAVADLASLTYEEAMVHREYYRAFLEMGPFSGEQKYEVLHILCAVFSTRPRVPVMGSEVLWGVVRREINRGMAYVDDLYQLDRESAKLEGTREDRNDASIGENSGKAGGSKRGPQENREGGNDMRTSPRNPAGATPKKTKVSDASRKLAEIEKQTAEFKATLIEQMMAEEEEDPQGAGSCEGRRIGHDEARYEEKDNSHKGTPSKKGKDKNDPPAEGTENATTPPAIDSGTNRLPATPKVTGACDGLWSLRKRVLGWFDPEGTLKTREKQRESKEGEGTSATGEAGSSEGGLKRIVTTLTRALNKNQGYLANAKKKLTFDGANITEFLIEYENLAALLKWTEEEKMEHLGQHVSLSLGRDITAIVASSGSWKETRNEMMRKYLKAEKMATEAELAAVQRKNYATYNDFLRAFTLVALRIPGVTNRIMSKYFLMQFSEFDKDKILSAYQQTSKFEYTRDVDFSTVTNLAEKTVVTETLALLKEGEVIDLTGKTGDKVKKGIESLHERVHGVDSKMDRMENALLVMQAQVSRPALPPQEAVVPAAVANRGFGRRDPANEQCKYCTMIGHFVRACPRLNHDIERQRCSRSLKGEILGPKGERVNWNSPGGMRRAVILLNNLEIGVVEAEPIAEIVWDQPRGRGPQANFILEGNGQDRVNITTCRAGAEKKLIQDTVMEELAGTSTGQLETDGKPREDEPVDKVTATKKKSRYQISILTSPEIDGTLSKLLGTMVSVSFQTMLQASPRLLKGLGQLLTRQRVEVEEAPELQEQDTEEAEAPQGVSNLQSIPGGLEDLEKAFADIRLSLPDREGGEVMRAPPGTKLSFHALPVGKLKVQIGTHHTDALVDGGAEITLIRRDFATVTGCTVNKEVAGSIWGASGEIPFTGYVTKCAVRAGIRESIWSFQRMILMEEMDHDVILGRPWCANVEMIGMHLHDDTYMVDIEDPVTGRGELLRLLGTEGDPPKGKLATWSPTFEESERKGAFARMEGMRERVEIVIEEAFNDVADTMKIGVEGFLTAEETQLIRKVCQECHLAFAFNDHQKGRLDAKLVPLVRIHMVEHECWNDKGHAYEFGIAAEVTDLLRAKIDSFVAEPTASPYENKWFVFRKPNKTLRWIQDLQKLNAVTIRDAGSLPQTDLLAESHAGQSIYSLIDLYSGYDQLPLDVRDRQYTATHTPVGQLQMQVTPMGFTNAIAEAQRRMLAVAGDMFPKKCEPYIDDNPVKDARYKDETEVEPGVRKFVWDHLRDIKDLLQRFLVYNITASGPKSILAVLEVTILGFRCGAYRRRPDPAKTDKISQWPTPLRTTTEVRAFLGVVGFWRIFIKRFAKMAEPIRAMIREGGTMDWTEDREAATQTLKDILSSDQVTLAAPCFNDEAQKEWQYLVNQTREEQVTDQKEQEFFLIQMYEGVFREIGLLLVGNKQPKEVSPKAREEAEKYVLRNGHLFKKEEGMMPRRVVCGRSRQLDVIQAMHDGLAGGHRSSKGTLAKIVPLYFWPGMAGMVATYCQTCLICQERSSVRVYEPLRPTRVLGPGYLVHLDLAVMPVSTDGLTYILDARDNLSGYVEAVALKKKTGKAVADWVEDFYLRHPFVRRFIADNGTEFVNQEVLNRLKTLRVPIKITEPYHPEANAPVERGHRTLKNTIAKLATENLASWPRFLKQAVFAENMTPKRTTGCIPTELWYGREINFPVEALVPTWNRLDDGPHLTTEELVTAHCQQVARTEEALEEVVNRVTDSRMRDKARWDQVKNVRKEPLQVGEKVLVRNSALESTWSGQLGKRFKGPYRIAKQVGLNTFELEDLDGLGKEQTANGKMEFGNKNDSNAINRPAEGQSSRQAGESSSRKRKLYVGFDHNLVVNRGGKKQGTRGSSPLKEGEPIELPSDSDLGSNEEGNPEEGQRSGENEPVEFIDLTNEEEEDEVTTPTREERGREEEPGEKKDKWIEEFGTEFSDWFDQWGEGKGKAGQGTRYIPNNNFLRRDPPSVAEDKEANAAGSGGPCKGGGSTQAT
ncbi:hypothetical protein CBR_g49432 [Chara braunii]|uniref:Integrase catalytic domain-containing protein n=1 Tax=Chara braunii TaxID=69332 RepID=A0A388M583_CHABU|nr:hypothetical protein CBR_g49432 [Chara braunii]|eukprot:GBG89643.1 hypothetical protein CBR_g49432 [Chara braunii]